MRLIDAEEFLILETVAYIEAQAEINDKITRFINEAVHKKLQMLVSQAPTAYDVDKVVERLAKGSYKTTDTVCGGRFDAIRLSSVIEIVKGGGVEC